MTHGHQRWNQDTITSAIRVFVTQQQRMPRSSDFQARLNGLPSPDTVRRYFPAGWVEALMAAMFVRPATTDVDHTTHYVR